MRREYLVVLIGLLPVSAASAQFFDDFESYPDTPAMMMPGAWGDEGGTPQATLWPAPNGNPGQAMWHNGARTAKHVIAPLTPTDAQPVVWEFDFYDDGTPSKRMSGGLRDDAGGGTLNSILEMGIHNSLHPESGAQPHSYAIRTVFIGGDPVGLGGWVAFVENPSPVTGWHHFKATIGASSINFELDLLDNGTIDGTRLITTADGAGIAYNVLRLGGPSDVSTTAGAGFDNVNIYQVPEPATLLLVVLGGVVCLRRR